MGLKKDFKLKNGINLNYHRIVSINKIINVANIIEVASYIDEEQREIEKKAIADGTEMDVLIETEYIQMDYDEEDNVKKAYEKIKKRDKFKGAKDI